MGSFLRRERYIDYETLIKDIESAGRTKTNVDILSKVLEKSDDSVLA